MHFATQLKHGEIAEVPISVGLERKLKVTKAKEMKAAMKIGAQASLIEVDIRNMAIGLAKNELQAK